MQNNNQTHTIDQYLCAVLLLVLDFKYKTQKSYDYFRLETLYHFMLPSGTGVFWFQGEDGLYRRFYILNDLNLTSTQTSIELYQKLMASDKIPDTDDKDEFLYVGQNFDLDTFLKDVDEENVDLKLIHPEYKEALREVLTFILNNPNTLLHPFHKPSQEKGKAQQAQLLQDFKYILNQI
jgi:hypothetical protein